MRDGCGCTPCREAWTEYRSGLPDCSRRRYALVDPTPMRERVASLIAGGVTVAQIADAIDVRSGTLRFSLSGTAVRPAPGRVSKRLADAIMSLDAADLAAAQSANAKLKGQARVHVDNLVLRGWSHAKIAEEADLSPQVVRRISSGGTCNASTARAIRLVHDRATQPVVEFPRRPPAEGGG